MKPFDFQEEGINDTSKAFKKSKRVIFCAATGYGKGVVIAEVARRAIAKGSVICISCHRKEIFGQIFNNLIQFGITPGLIAAGKYPSTGHRCYLSMVGTFCRRMKRDLAHHLKINFFMLDEVHRGEYYKLVKELDNEYVLGLTATPKSTGKPELKDYFDDIVCGIPISELINIGRLLPAHTYSIKHDFSKVRKKGQDFDQFELMKEFKKPVLREGAVENYLKHGENRKAICYNVSVEQSLDVVRQFRAHGIEAAHVDGTTSDHDRDAIFRMYKNDKIHIISNIEIATTGTDLPTTGCIIQNFATMSLVKHVQTLGRGARVNGVDENFIIIDMGRNWVRHSKYGEDIDWVHIFNNPSAAVTKEEKKRSNRECDECGAVIKFNLRQCPYCSSFISQQELEEKMLVGATLEEIREYKFSKLPPTLRRPVLDMSDNEIKTYGRILGYNFRWAHKMIGLKNKRNRR